jgi:hypothetical protein
VLTDDEDDSEDEGDGHELAGLKAQGDEACKLVSLRERAS